MDCHNLGHPSNGSKHCKALGQDIEIKNQKLKIKILLAGWIENPIKSKVLTFPIDKIVFPTVTLCPRDSRPDRWGTAIKIFDYVNTDCGSKRWHSMFNPKANDNNLNSIQKFKEKKSFHINISFQLSAILTDLYPLFMFFNDKRNDCFRH